MVKKKYRSHNIAVLYICCCSLALTGTRPDGFKVWWFYIWKHPKAQMAVVSFGLKSPLTDWESLNLGYKVSGLSIIPGWLIHGLISKSLL